MTDNDSVNTTIAQEQEKAEGKGDNEGNAVNAANSVSAHTSVSSYHGEDSTDANETFEETWSPDSPKDSDCNDNGENDDCENIWEEEEEGRDEGDYDIRRPEDLLPTLVLLNAFFARKPPKTPSPLKGIVSKLRS